MDNSFLNHLLTEYNVKRTRALTDLENRKNKLKESSSEYLKLEQNLHILSLESLKSLLTLSPEDKKRKLKELEEKTNSIIRQKKDLLKTLHLPSDYLEPHFDCNLCQDTGYVENSLCSCIKQKLYNLAYNRANIGNIDRENFEFFNFDLYSDEPNPVEYNSKFSPKENIKKIYDISKKFIANFDSPDEKNLMFLGPTGLGKTFLSNCVAKSILDSGKTVLYQTAPVMLDEIIAEKFQNSSSLMENILSVDLLIIDDLGTETMNNMKFTELFNIINTRLLNQNHKITKTIISTNLDIKDIFTVYDERIGSRIVGNYNLCRFFR
jgi:DNA replication protein DnaC